MSAGLGELDAAVAALQAGELVAFPTETVYGLGADAFNAAAVARVFERKGRPSDNPLIVHVADVRMAKEVVAAWPQEADRVATTFWPGPLTIVLPKSARIPDIVTGGGATVGVRCPDHPMARALLERFGSPLVGPSANASGAVSPTTAAHVRAEFGDDIPVLDGGACRAGIESTVLWLASRPFRVLRPGVVGPDALAAVLGEEIEITSTSDVEGPAPSPGMLERHYSPRTPCVLVDDWEGLKPADLCVLAIGDAPADATVIRLPREAEGYARELYDALRRADAIGAALIAIERPPREGRDAAETALWVSIADRLSRAAAR